MKPTTTPGPANKLLGLEVLRFLTAFAILVYHYRHFAFADKTVGLVDDRLPLYRLLHVFYDGGPYGVWIFWCISGFIFFWKYRDAIADRSVGGWKFFALRFSRLYPLHIATLLLVALVQPLYFNLNGYFFVYQDNDLTHFLLQLLMASNWGFQDALSFDGPIWSISVEVLVYFFFFIMLLATRSWLLNVVIIAACLTASGQIAACFAFFYAGGLAAMARRAMMPSVYRLAAESTGWLAVIVFPLWALAGHQRPFGINGFSTVADRYADPVVLPLSRHRHAGFASEGRRGRRQHDVFELPAAFSDSTDGGHGFCDIPGADPSLRRHVLRAFHRNDAGGVASHLPVFRGAGTKPDP
jgi:peptidoglycan/LPS O-acetylase OafA/YrhL